MDGSDVERAVARTVALLGPATGDDWSVPAGDLEWSCWTTAAHLAHDLLAYTGQVAGRPADGYLPFDLRVRADATPSDLLRVVSACGRLLGDTIGSAEPAARGWHWGATDPGGFAALGVNETIVHTYDIACGLGLDRTLPGDLAAGVIARLFPEAPDGDPGEVLLWCTGRAALPDRPRQDAWVLQAARD